MKKMLLAFILLPCVLKAQTGWHTPPKDSAAYYQRQISELWRNTMDSLRHSETFKNLQDSYEYHIGRSNNYRAFMIFFDILHSDYNSLNTAIAQSGFPALNPLGARLGFGYSSKKDHVMFDFAFAVIGFNNKTKKADEKIAASLSNLLQFDIGYDILKSRTVSIYPYAGLSVRNSIIEYSKPRQINQNYTNITNIIANDQSILANNFRPGYQAGIGFDFTSSDKIRTAKAILFIKIGTNRPFGEETFKIEDIKYGPGIKQGDWLATIGFKFGSKQ
jgi:hypothetical protein